MAKTAQRKSICCKLTNLHNDATYWTSWLQRADVLSLASSCSCWNPQISDLRSAWGPSERWTFWFWSSTAVQRWHLERCGQSVLSVLTGHGKGPRWASTGPACSGWRSWAHLERHHHLKLSAPPAPTHPPPVYTGQGWPGRPPLNHGPASHPARGHKQPIKIRTSKEQVPPIYSTNGPTE